MAEMKVEVPELVQLRLEALSSASGKSLDELIREGLESLVSLPASRRAIVKARRAAAKAAGTSYSLADLGWLDGYAGQSIDELLAFDGMEKDFEILFTLEQAIQKKLEMPGPKNFTGVERIVLSLQALQREVNNGGFDQFFVNSSRKHTAAVVGDLIRIECPEIADITQRAIDALGVVPLTTEEIDEAMRREDPARARIWERCDIEFHQRTEIAQKLLAYVKAHPNGIRL